MNIHQEITFNCNPKQLFKLLSDSQQFSKFSGAQAEIDANAGGKFSAFGGMIYGQTVEVQVATRLVQAWRVANWPPGIYSIAKFELESDDESETKLIFDHTGYPQEFTEHLEQGWYERYWDPIKKYLARKE